MLSAVFLVQYMYVGDLNSHNEIIFSMAHSVM